MSNISDYAVAQILAAFPADVAPTLPPLYLALCSSLPTHTETGATIPELTSAGNYQRAPIVFGGPSAGASVNSNLITFAVSSGAYSAAAAAYAIVDSLTIGAGNLWYFAALAASITVTSAFQQIVFPIGSISLGLS